MSVPPKAYHAPAVSFDFASFESVRTSLEVSCRVSSWAVSDEELVLVLVVDEELALLLFELLSAELLSEELLLAELVSCESLLLSELLLLEERSELDELLSELD
jgi:hypothetical protein